MAAQDLKLFRNAGLSDAATSQDTSHIGEPAVAVSGSQVFMTGNWFASRSVNAGATWTHVNPFTALPSAAGGFCCDQVVIHDRRRELWIWILQYVQSNGTNVFRIAASRDGTFPTGAWYWWDISPATLNGQWTNVWFDYPDAALTNDHLWLTFNVFNASDQWQRAAVMKFPLATIANAGTLVFNAWTTTQNGSIRLTQGAGQTMYFGSHINTSTLRVFRWEDAGNSINWWDVNVAAWTSGNFTSLAPNGVDWLGRVDARITGAWVAQNRIGFMWTGGAQTGRPHPYVRVVRIDETTKAVVDQPDIWSQQNAWAYPAACPNERGEVGFAAFYGGPTRHPSPVVGLRDDGTGAWKSVLTVASTHSPTGAAWGDYLVCRSHAPYGHTWVASGYALRGGSNRRDIEPRYAQFGFEKDTP
ncbi:MAG: hypothetical protein ACXWEI_16615 [Mycobacterium sp.]